MNITINANGNSKGTIINNETTLNELLGSLGNVTRAEKTPTPKKLSETGGTVVAKADGCMAYSCGYAVYDNGSGRTVMWLPDCVSFFIRKETRREMLESMTDKQREVFTLYYYDGLKQREIAESLGISRDSVNDRLEGALKKVKKLF